ncbi:histidine protein methyltransferase 1 homolog isoform X2 [Belonocnema kinseyi]|uniref:histidine protein methyltransferase 1 homolog isoform X2 n=1 Tax=Belonocnema kinseyi TaxID=2817044 RepID=UPI00143DE308|nr:histidine protein methyltransferase 1 homolog isoform X2 [Belonocnema kinseyi]
MFKFSFSEENLEEGCLQEQNRRDNDRVNWFPASEVNILSEQMTKKYESNEYEEDKSFHNISLKLINSDKVAIALTGENSEVVTEAESQKSDLIAGKYEGGLKVWESTRDLVRYLLEQKYSFENKKVLDLGCGAGVIGILCLMKGSTVHFQDYNVEVIRFVTIPNVILNLGKAALAEKKNRFYSGDWKSFTSLMSNDVDDAKEKYDYIFTSETIYNPDNHKKLYNVFKQRLKSNGFGFVAGKAYYFGVGGSMRQFEELVRKDGVFKVQVVWRSNEGLQRDILALSRCNSDSTCHHSPARTGSD